MSVGETARDVVIAELKRRAVNWLFSPPGLIALLVIVILMILAGLAMAAAGSQLPSGGVNATPSPEAQQLIPPGMLGLYRSQLVQRQCPGLSWTIVAAIGHIESNDGRNRNTSSAGAMGPMQFEPSTWDPLGRPIVRVKPYGRVPGGYGLDGDGDGLANIRDPYDAVPAAARYLCANGGGNPATLPRAIFQYNHAQWYVDQVMTLANRLGRISSTLIGNPSMAARTATGFAVSRYGTPYVWGGSSPEGGFDCSGLVWWAYHEAGFPFARTTAAGEYNWPGVHVGYNQLQEGDIIFWGPDPTNPATIDHAALYVGVINGVRMIIVAREPGTTIQYEPLYHDAGSLHFVAGLRVSAQ